MSQYEICKCCGKPKRPKQQSKRFPSNLLLSHSIFCVANGSKNVKGTAPRGKPSCGEPTSPNGITYSLHNNSQGIHYASPDGTELIEDFECAEGCPIAELNRQGGIRKSGGGAKAVNRANNFASGGWKPDNTVYEGSEGTVSRYFQNFPPSSSSIPDLPEGQGGFVPFLYCAKASRAERNKGCEGLPDIQGFDKNTSKHIAHINHETGNTTYNEYHPSKMQNGHPTVKPQALMRWLIRLVGVPNGIILDPFCGSGSTLVACIAENMHFIGIEQSDTPEEPYVSIARSRIQDALQQREGAQQKAQGAMKDEEEREYICAEECPIRVLGEQSGKRKSSYPDNPDGAMRYSGTERSRKHNVYGNPSVSYKQEYSDTGTAARYFTQFPPDSLFSSLPLEEPHEVQEQAEHTCHDV